MKAGNRYQKFAQSGFIAAGIANIGGVLLFSRVFTNEAINEADPVVMSNFGLLLIVVWGLVFLACATVQANLKWIAGAFAIEKLVFAAVWVKWQFGNSLAAVYDADLFAGVFYSIYGLNDLMFMLFFAWVFANSRKIYGA